MTISPFDFINDLSSGKSNLLKNSVDAEKDYVPFLVNRGFSYFADTVMAANEMNKSGHLTKKMQHDFYFNEVRKSKRWSKWPKKIVDSDLQAISEYYHINNEKAKEYLSLLDNEQIDQIKKTLNKGGKL